MVSDSIPVYYLGPQGSYSHSCAQALPGEHDLIPCSNFTEIFSQAAASNAMGLVPVENSLGGNVAEVLDLMWQYSPQLHIQLEYVLKIEHCLITQAANHSEIKEIRTHGQSLAQCQDYIQANIPHAHTIHYSSNSAGVQSLLDSPNREHVATIASSDCAEIYNIPILDTHINDNENNFTRFWLITPQPPCKWGKNALSSFAFRLPQDQSGGLTRILQPLADNNINLTKIFSRPHKGRLHEYTFYIDYVGDYDLSNIYDLCSEYRFFGSYSVMPKGDKRF